MNFRDSLKIHSLTRFQKCFSFIYTLLGMTPSVKSGLGRNITFEFLNISVKVVYWIGIGWSFTIGGSKDSQVSIISNIIQLLLNTMAYTVAAVNPILKYKTYSKIIRRLNKINEQLEEINMYPKDQPRMFNFITTAFFVALVFNCAFTFYVSVIKAASSAPYWILHALPLFIYATSCTRQSSSSFPSTCDSKWRASYL